MKDGGKTPENFRFCDVLADAIDIESAFALLYKRLNDFLDRYSMVSYGKSNVHHIFSVCPHEVLIGEEFDLAIPQFTTERKTIPVRLDQLSLGIQITPEQQRWIRLMRNGLNSTSEEDRYLNLYSLLEEIAQQESEDFVIVKCNHCSKETNTGRKATNNFISGILDNHGLDKSAKRMALKLRNKIAHGGVMKDKEFLKDVREIGSHLEEICLLELEARLPLGVVNRLNAHIVDIPIVTHRFICKEDKTFELIRSNQQTPARFVKLKHNDETVYEGQTVMIGLPLDRDGRPFIDPFSFPTITE